MEFNFLDKVPHRTPEKHFDNFIDYIKDKKIVDLGCGSGDTMLYMKHKLNCKEIYGVDNTNRSDLNENIKRFNIKVYKKNILDHDFTGSDTYFIWIEKPDIEGYVVNKLKKYCQQKNKKCDVIIAYNTKGGCEFNKNILNDHNTYNNKCTSICRWLGGIPYKMQQLEKHLYGNFNYKKVKYNYIEGDKCRESGEFTYFIVNI